VVSETDTAKTRPNQPESTAFVIASTSPMVVAVVAGTNKRSPITSRAHGLAFSEGYACGPQFREPTARRLEILGSWSWTPRSVYWRLALYNVGGGMFKDEPPPPTIEACHQFLVGTSYITGTVLALMRGREKGSRLVRAHVSRQSSNARRRKGTVKSPRGIQARDRREICSEILHHKCGWKYCSSVSLRGVGADRRESS